MTVTPDIRTHATYDGTTYRNGQIPARLLAPLDGLHGRDGTMRAELRRDAAAAFNAARRDAAAIGETLQLRGWYRTLAEQQEFYDRPHDAAVAVPGYSNHGLALAIDVRDVGGVGEFGNARRRKLDPILKRHGFTDTEGRRVNEPWHYVYDPAADRGTDPEEVLDMTEAQLKAALTEWAKSTAGRKAICAAVWNTDGVVQAPADTDRKKDPYWAPATLLKNVRLQVIRLGKKGA